MKAGLWVIDSSLYNCTHCKVLDLIISQLSKLFYAIFINWNIDKLLNIIAIHWTHLLLYFTALFLFLSKMKYDASLTKVYSRVFLCCLHAVFVFVIMQDLLMFFVPIETQMVTHCNNTVQGFKRFHGRAFSDPFVQNLKSSLVYDLSQMPSGMTGIKVSS